jgi:hypothetical protein
VHWGGPESGSPSQAERDEEHHLYATVRRYESVDKVRSEEITRKVRTRIVRRGRRKRRRGVRLDFSENIADQ